MNWIKVFGEVVLIRVFACRSSPARGEEARVGPVRSPIVAEVTWEYTIIHVVSYM